MKKLNYIKKCLWEKFKGPNSFGVSCINLVKKNMLQNYEFQYEHIFLKFKQENVAGQWQQNYSAT